MSVVRELGQSLVSGHVTGVTCPRSREYAWVWQFVRPQAAMLAVLMGFSLLATALALSQPWLTKLLIDEGLLARDYDRLLWIVACMVLVGISASALSGLNRYLHTRLSARILFALRENLYAHLQTLSPGFFGSRRLGDIVSRLDGDLAQIQRFAVDSLFSATTNTLSMLGALVLMASLEPMLTLMVLAVVPLEVLYLRRMRGKVEQGAREVRERSTDVGAFVIETLPATKFIQAVGAEQRELARLRSLGERHLSSLLRFQLTEYATSAVPGLITSLARAAAFVVGGYQVIQGEWQLGALIAFSAYLAMVAGPVQSLLGLYVAVQRVAVNFDRVLEIRRVKPAVSSPADPEPLPATMRGEIVFNDVVFAHPDRRERVLDGACAVFPAGRKVVLVGPSGAGKSTLIDLVMRYQDPVGGRILLDGIPLPRLALTELRRCIAVVSQEIVLFRGSLRDNLRYANPAASDAEILRAVEDAQLSDFIASLPQGLDTELGERATQVSGGQKQRIAIARALLQNPSILLLDEATSAVDQDTEARVVAAIDRLFGDRTRIIVSHRPGNLVNADAVFVLDSGQLHPQTGQEAEHA